MNKSLQQYYLNAMGMPQWRLRQAVGSRLESEPQEKVRVYLAAGEAGVDFSFHDSSQSISETAPESFSQIESESINAEQDSHKTKPELVGVNESEVRESVINQTQSSPNKMPSSHALEALSEASVHSSPLPRVESNISQNRDIVNHTPNSQISAPISSPPDSNTPTIKAKSVPVENSAETLVETAPMHEIGQNALAQLETKIISCSQCQQRASGQDSVRGTFLLHPNADEENNLLILTEPPTEAEYHHGTFLTPAYKQLLMAIFKAVDLTAQNIYLSGILKCSPVDNHAGTDQELSNCQHFLEQELDIIQPKVIVCLGRSAAYLLDKKVPGDESDAAPVPLSLSKTRLERHEFNLGKHRLPLYSTFHPAFLYRNPLFKGKALEDWIKISAYLV